MANNVSAAYRRLRGLGLSPAQAAGAVGSLTGESGAGLDPNARNPTSGAIGIGQWLGGRATGVRAGDFQGQLNHLVGELKGGEAGALRALRGAKTPEQAAEIFTRAFERPSAGEIASSLPARQAAARRILAQHGGDAATSGTAAPKAAPGLKITGNVTAAGSAPSREEAAAQTLAAGAKHGLQDFRTSRLKEADHLFRLGLAQSSTPTKATQTITQTAPGAGGPADASKAAAVIARVNVFDKANNAGKLPYKWGGGHGGKLDPTKTGATPVDCSGLVSSAIGINPRVAAEFRTWGKPGEGGTITVYAKSTHVLAKVKGRDGQWHFFATSASNPGGGAGWVPASKISKSYLAGFTVRHN